MPARDATPIGHNTASISSKRPIDPRERRQELIAVGALVLGALGIAFAPIFAKMSMAGDNVGPVASAFWRVTFALPVFLGFVMVGHWRASHRLPANPKPSVPKHSRMVRIAWLALPGLLFAGDLATWHVALQYTSAASSTLLANLQAVIVGFVGWLFLKERLKGIFPVGAGLALTGVAVLLTNGPDEVEPGRNPLVGDLLSVVTACFYASYILSIKHLRREYSVITIMTIASAASSVCLLIVALARGDQMLSSTAKGWWALIGMGLVAHCMGQGLIAFALAKLPASFSAVSLLLQPVAVAVFGWLLLREALTPMQMAAGVMVLAGIYLARLGSR